MTATDAAKIGGQFSQPTLRGSAAHHRSEIATMLTMVSGSPPDTGINSYYRRKAEAQRV